MFMTTAPALRGYRYRTLRVVVGGCYPFSGGPNISGIQNAYQYALSEIEYQAAFVDASAVIGIRTIQADEFYVLVTGIAIKLDAVQYRVPPRLEEGPSWSTHIWDFVSDWTKDL